MDRLIFCAGEGGGGEGDLETGAAKALLENEVKKITSFVDNCNIEETTTVKMGYVVVS